VVIGVHSPEFAFEKISSNVASAVKRLGVEYPVALDSDYAIWQGFNHSIGRRITSSTPGGGSGITTAARVATRKVKI
jgi:hypothetical protein